MDTTGRKIWLSDTDVTAWSRDTEASERLRRRVRAVATKTAQRIGQTVLIVNLTGNIILDSVSPS